MKRALVSLSCLVLVGVAAAQPPAPTPAPTAPKSTGRVAVFNAVKVMRDYKKWQSFAKLMNERRTAEAGKVVQMRTDLAKMQQTLAAEVSPTKKDELTREMVTKQRAIEDAERTIGKRLDEESAGYLKSLFVEIQTCVQAIVTTNGFDIVFAYPDAMSKEEMESPMYFDLKLRPNAAMPFYISPHNDITGVLIDTLNKYYPAPAEPATPPAPAK